MRVFTYTACFVSGWKGIPTLLSQLTGVLKKNKIKKKKKGKFLESKTFQQYFQLLSFIDNEPRHEKTGFLPMRKQKGAHQLCCAVTAQLISAFVFATQIV